MSEPELEQQRSRILGQAVGALQSLANGIADIIVPPVCLSCHTRLGAHNSLCARCWSRINFIRPPLCNLTGLPLPFDTGGTTISADAAANPPAYNRARAVAHYDGVMRALIHDFKYRDQHDGRRLFARWLISAGTDLIADADLVAPVPLYRWRLLRRRFNQAAVLALEIARQSGLAYDPLALKRIRRTESQVGKTADQRRRNVAGAFAVAGRARRRIDGRHILLVDDVITTGATAGACARALKQAGAARVDVLSLAMRTGQTVIIP